MKTIILSKSIGKFFKKSTTDLIELNALKQAFKNNRYMKEYFEVINITDTLDAYCTEELLIIKS